MSSSRCKRFAPLFFLSWFISLSPALTAEQEVKEYSVNPEETVSVPISEFVSPDLLKGTGYSLQEEAKIYRSVAIFRLNTPLGVSEVVSTVGLLERINEIRAVATLEEMKKSDVYLDALKKSGRAPVDFAKNLVTSPVDTVSNAAKGLGGFLADVGHSLVSDDPSQENAAKTALGFAAAKRQFAFQLGVNPYSQYQPLQDALDDVSWAAVGGGLTVAAGFRAVQGSPGQVLSLSRTANSMRELVRDNSPRKLQNINAEKLLAMGVTEELVDAFLDNHAFDPEDETRIVGALESMKDVAGRSDVIALAALAQNRARAAILRDSVELIESYHATVKPAEQLIVVSGAPFIVTSGKAVQSIAAVDYATMTPGLEGRIKAATAELGKRGFKPGDIWATGKVDKDVKALLIGQGWQQVHERAETVLRPGPAQEQ